MSSTASNKEVKKSEMDPATAASSDIDIAQTFKDLARGEQTAQALESNLTSLERKLDHLLASLEESEGLKADESKNDKEKNDADARKI